MTELLQSEGALSCSRALPSCAAWLVTDGSAGAFARTNGVARALSLDLGLRHVVVSSSLPALDFCASPRTGSPWPDIAIAAGRGTVPYLKTLRRASEGATFTVLLQHPRIEVDAADLIWCLADDRVQSANVTWTLTTPHAMRQSELLALRRTPAPEIETIARPIAAVLLGGPDSTSSFDAVVLDCFAASLKRFADAGIGFLVVSSPRTTPELLQTAVEATRGARRIIWTGGDRDPYWTFLAHADLAIVTGDSVNMTSEACATGKPVYVFEPGGNAARNKEFHLRLREYGATRVLTADVDPLATWAYRPLDSAPYIANEIGRRFNALREPMRRGAETRP